MFLLLLRFFLSPVLPSPVPSQGTAREFFSPPELGGLVRLLGIYPTVRCFAVFDSLLFLPLGAVRQVTKRSMRPVSPVVNP